MTLAVEEEGGGAPTLGYGAGSEGGHGGCYQNLFSCMKHNNNYGLTDGTTGKAAHAEIIW